MLEADLERAAPALVGKRVREVREEERPTRAVPRVPFGDLKAQPAAVLASACSRTPAPGQGREDPGAAVPSVALRFPSRLQRRLEPGKTCFPAPPNLITLFLTPRKAEAFGLGI